ncbi:uncharacterized protein LY89DRAFT_502079 [Mollisia scopiformis]|uniref:Uncharacterized protein n=1 Tax=Mollisia scopiformis TaxID=149040 RepID=A0A194XER3_MOLSC|nr:uncharacterized protein LY89DRAFT_502079 [Mollisia scopiformis]KUJ18680.1 hypothetical protein LY89DRAFT_502079 [Mollisia scopiformis]
MHVKIAGTDEKGEKSLDLPSSPSRTNDSRKHRERCSKKVLQYHPDTTSYSYKNCLLFCLLISVFSSSSHLSPHHPSINNTNLYSTSQHQYTQTINSLHCISFPPLLYLRICLFFLPIHSPASIFLFSFPLILHSKVKDARPNCNFNAKARKQRNPNARRSQGLRRRCIGGSSYKESKVVRFEEC